MQVRRYLDDIRATLAYWQDAYELPFQPLLHLTGGESLLHPAFWDVLEHARGEGFGLSVLTNGTLVDTPKAERLASLGVESVQVSVEGPPLIHDAIRGAGSLARTLTGTARLVAAESGWSLDRPFG